MHTKLRGYIDALRANRYSLMTCNEAANQLEQLLADPVATAFTAEQLQVVEELALRVGNRILEQAALQADEKIAQALKHHVPNAIQ